MNVPEAFAFEIANGASQLLTLLADDVWSKVAVCSLAIAILAEAIRQVEHKRDRKDVIVACELNERLARFGLHVGGVNDGKFRGRETFGGDVVQDFEGIFRCCLVVFIV